MLDIPKLGMQWLDRLSDRVAQNEEDSEVFEQSMTIVETAKLLVGDTDTRRAIAATAMNSKDKVRRECDVMRSLTEAEQVRRML